MDRGTEKTLAENTALCYGHFAVKSRSRREFLPRGSAWQRGAAGLAALVACGFLAPTALAAPPPPAASQLPDGGATDPAAATAPTQAPAADPSDTATTGQTAGSTATATQQQPVNLVVVVRVNSPGNNGPITQSNIVAAPSAAANNATTSQAGNGGNAASTAQQANASATATQDAAGNVVITVRIDSPGKNGAVAQTNGVVGSSSGTNTSDTTQQVAAPTTAVLPQAHHVGAVRSRKAPSRHHPSRHRQLTAAVRAPAESSPPPAATAVEPAPVTPDRTTTAPAPAHRHPAVTRGSHGSSHHRVTLSSIAGGAAKVLKPFIPQKSPVAEAAGPQDVSRAVLLTLLALAGATAAFAVFRRATVRRQAASWRPPR